MAKLRERELGVLALTEDFERSVGHLYIAATPRFKPRDSGRSQAT